MARKWLACVCVLLALSAAALAKPKAKPPSKADQARMYFEEGTKYYSLRDFPKAVANYKKAFELRPEPVLLYNIAQAYRLSRDFDDSLYFYKSYLRNEPNAANRAEVEGRIAEMEAAVQQQERAAKPPNDAVTPGEAPTSPGDTRIPSPEQVAEETDEPETETEAAPPSTDSGSRSRPVYKKWWFWTGIAAVAVGTVVVVAASSGGGGSSDPNSHFGREDIF